MAKLKPVNLRDSNVLNIIISRIFKYTRITDITVFKTEIDEIILIPIPNSNLQDCSLIFNQRWHCLDCRFGFSQLTVILLICILFGKIHGSLIFILKIKISNIFFLFQLSHLFYFQCKILTSIFEMTIMICNI